MTEEIECTCQACTTHNPLSNSPKGHFRCTVCKKDLTNISEDLQLYVHQKCWVEKYSKSDPPIIPEYKYTICKTCNAPMIKCCGYGGKFYCGHCFGWDNIPQCTTMHTTIDKPINIKDIDKRIENIQKEGNKLNMNPIIDEVTMKRLQDLEKENRCSNFKCPSKNKVVPVKAWVGVKGVLWMCSDCMPTGNPEE